MTQATVFDLLVPLDEAKSRLQQRLDLIANVRAGALGHLTWYDETIKILDATFATMARQYFSREAGFEFEYVMYKGRQFRGANLDRTEGILRRMIAWLDNQTPSVEPTVPGRTSNKVFVVHGHDERRLLEVKEVLKSQGLKPIVLKDEPNGGATIIEKFEKNSDVGFAVVLITGDDMGSAKAAAGKLSPRARQNVILELGYFLGKLSRARISALNESGVELPSDIHGLVYTVLDDGGAWRYKLLDELKHAGYIVDKNNL